MDGYYDIRGINEHVVGLFYYGIGSPRNVAMFNKVTRVVEKVSTTQTLITRHLINL